MKKALLTISTSNAVGIEDMQALEALLRRANFQVDEIIELRKLVSQGPVKRAIEDYDLIAFGVPYAALHMSGASNLSGMKDLIMRAKEGALALVTSDTSFTMNPKMWDGPNSNPHKENPYLLRPFKVLGSFQEEILSDPEAIARINFIWMRFLHPKSEFIPLEWQSGMIDFLPERIVNDSKYINGLFNPESRKIDKFYYGISKPKLFKSLRGLGLGKNSDDAVYGSIAKNFPNVVDLSPPKGSPNNRSLWTPLVVQAQQNLLPYDPVKSQYQFTKRFLELALLNPSSVVPDPRIKEELLEYLKIEPWHTTAARVSKQLNNRF